MDFTMEGRLDCGGGGIKRDGVGGGEGEAHFRIGS